MRDFFNGLVPIASFVMTIAVVWFMMREKIARSRLRTDLQKEVLAKFSSGQELKEFLNSESGKWFMEDKSVSKWAGRGRAITLVVAGIISIGAGIGLLFGPQSRQATGLFISVGLALIVSGIISNILAKKMGLGDQSTGERAKASGG
jgi:hypothetical protein